MKKLDLEALRYLYDYLKDKEELYKITEDYENITFQDFENYIIDSIIDNIEYDLGINFTDYVDLNNFIEEEN